MYEFCKTLLIAITFLFILYLFIYSIYFLMITIREVLTLRIFQRQQKFSNYLYHDYLIPVSILLGTYNDEKKVVNMVQSLLSLNYKLYEIIIIDDHSSDQTVSRLIQAFQLKGVEKPIRKQLQTKNILEIYQVQKEHIKITLLKKEHGGMADTFNVGINAAYYPYFLCLNTNFSLQENSLQNLVRPILEDENVAACNGVVRVGKMSSRKGNKIFHLPKGLLRKAQVLEYNRFSMLSRKRNEDFGLPSFVLFRKNIAISVLGFDKDAVGENFELTRKVKEYAMIHRESCIVKSAPNSVAFIDVPGSLLEFIKQRRTWNFGLSKNMLRYKKDVSIRCSIHTFYLPFIEFVGIIAMILSCILSLVDISLIGLFLGSFILFCAFLSLSIFLFKLWTEDKKLSFVDFIKSGIASIVEASIIRIFVIIANMASFFGNKK